MALSSPDKFLLILLKKQDFLVVSNYMGKIVMELKGEEKVKVLFRGTEWNIYSLLFLQFLYIQKKK